MTAAYGDVFRSRSGNTIVMFIREEKTTHEGQTWRGLILVKGRFDAGAGEVGTFRPLGAVNPPGAQPVWEALT